MRVNTCEFHSIQKALPTFDKQNKKISDFDGVSIDLGCKNHIMISGNLVQRKNVFENFLNTGKKKV